MFSLNLGTRIYAVGLLKKAGFKDIGSLLSALTHGSAGARTTQELSRIGNRAIAFRGMGDALAHNVGRDAGIGGGIGAGIGEVVESRFCHFRRYGWCWNGSLASDQGFGGITVANGELWWLPIAGASVAEVLRTTMAVALERWSTWLQKQVDYVAKKQGEAHYSTRALACIAVEMASTAIQFLIEDAIRDAEQNGNAYFERLSKYRGAVPCLSDTCVKVEGFEPDAAWAVLNGEIIGDAYMVSKKRLGALGAKAAFTLVELLVVVAIIGLAILLLRGCVR